MKLLIVDDEELTREGLISSINWNTLGIDQVLQAEDGVAALRIAKIEQPEIVLCDVRMPRMDGITLIAHLEELMPDITVIFMSGYSDKEYLKAAIRFKAVNYVEKPLNSQEISDAVLEAKKRYQQKMTTRQHETRLSMETAAHLALLLTRPYKREAQAISALAQELFLKLPPLCSFTAFIVNLDQADPDSYKSQSILQNLETFLASYHLQVFYVSKHIQYQVFHIFAPFKPSPMILDKVGRYLAEQFTSLGNFTIARGETVSGIAKAYQSYTTAAALIQSSFFSDVGQILTPPKVGQELDVAGIRLGDNPPSFFSKLLLAKDENGCGIFLDHLYHFYYQSRSAFSNQVKDLYYKLFMVLQESRQALTLSFGTRLTGNSETIMEHLNRCFTFGDLHLLLQTDTAHFFESLNSYEPEDSTIFQIKEYINQHYSDETLSVKDVGEHVFLSASYVCTYFKNETGQTLNQYLTACRMEKAKQLLSDPQYQIADISSKVGYNNGNYFSKSFKKSVGLSPSEYREKMMR